MAALPYVRLVNKNILNGSPIVALIVGIVVGGDVIDAVDWIAVGLMLVSVAIVQFSTRDLRERPEANSGT